MTVDDLLVTSETKCHPISGKAKGILRHDSMDFLKLVRQYLLLCSYGEIAVSSQALGQNSSEQNPVYCNERGHSFASGLLTVIFSVISSEPVPGG